MTPDPTNEERQAAQEIIFAHPIWNSPNFTTLAIDLRIELTRREKQVAEARERFEYLSSRWAIVLRGGRVTDLDEAIESLRSALEATK